ncbi:MAG: protein kinase domain-containing protein [Acidimicrobiales bacterium]
MPDSPPAHRAPPSAFPAGRLISGRYRLDRRIASGGMAEVWEATDEVLGRPVAVKILHPHLAADDTFVLRFRSEAIAAARLHHPGIVAIYDTCHDHDAEAIVMELVNGTTLRALLDERSFLPPEQVVSIGAQVADALAAAHRAGLVHRDIKPANILICADGRALVTDFGIAKIRDDPDVTQTGTMLGTVKYLAPEQVRGERLDGRADLYALGVVLYEALCARAPFSGDTPAATALARLHQLPPHPRQLRTTIPRGLDAVVMRCLQLDRDHRFANALELRAALLEPSTLHEPDDLTVTAAVDPTTSWASQPSPHASTSALAGDGVAAHGSTTGPVIVEPQSRWVRPAMAAIFVALALALAGVLIAGTSTGRQLFSWADKSTSTSTVDGSGAGGSDPKDLHIQAISSFDPGGAGTPGENDDQLRLAIDGNADTSWHTESYNQRRFGTKPGVGIVLTLTSAADLRRLNVASATQGWAASVYVLPSAGSLPTALSGWGDPVDQQTGINGDASFDLGNVRGQAILLWITDLGDGPPRVRAEIDELSVAG